MVCRAAGDTFGIARTLRCAFLHRVFLHRAFLHRIAGALLLSSFIGGCATTQNISMIDSLDVGDGSSGILIMPMDVELYVETASGLLEPKAEWSEAASKFLRESTIAKIESQGYVATPYHVATAAPDSDLVQLEKLHEAVGWTIMSHKLGPITAIRPLPTKSETFDWTLGSKSRVLKEETDADYALFMFFRDSYSSAGRIAVKIGMALLRYAVASVPQVGFASLVDLNTGDVVWFNYLEGGTGDARKEETAPRAVDELFDGFPFEADST